eukprot:8281960-Ditylum_brightwellii.AAC.1
MPTTRTRTSARLSGEQPTTVESGKRRARQIAVIEIDDDFDTRVNPASPDSPSKKQCTDASAARIRSA